MASFREYRRRSFIPMAGAILASIYLFIFLPLDRRVRELDPPLQKEWRHLAASLGKTNANSIDFLNITNQLDQTKRSLALIQETRDSTRRALALDPELRDRLATGSFQLIDYQIESSKKKDALASLAKQQKVSLDPSVLIGFPEYTVDVNQPELLWAALSMVHGLLTTAVQSKVGAIHSLVVPLVLADVPLRFRPRTVIELPFQIEVTGTTSAIATLLESVPMRGHAIQEGLGLSGIPKDKPPLFIDRLVIKKQTPEKPDEIRLSLQVVGFVLRE